MHNLIKTMSERNGTPNKDKNGNVIFEKKEDRKNILRRKRKCFKTNKNDKAIGRDWVLKEMMEPCGKLGIEKVGQLANKIWKWDNYSKNERINFCYNV